MTTTSNDDSLNTLSHLSIPRFHSFLGLVPRSEHLSACADLLSTIIVQQNIIDSLSRQLADSEGRRIRLEQSMIRNR